jgi:hypothetical protein
MTGVRLDHDAFWIESIRNHRDRCHRFIAEWGGKAVLHILIPLRSAKVGSPIYELILDYIGRALTNQASSDECYNSDV